MVRLLVPLVLSLPAWLALIAGLRRDRRGVALAASAVWAGLVAIGLALLEIARPGSCARLFPGSASYAHAMLAWVDTGQGCEGDLACFLPQHLLHLLSFSFLALVTAGLGGLAMGCVLLGWMGAYTAGLALASGNCWALVVGWHPWAVVRVAGYLLLGVVLSEPLGRRGLPPLPGRGRWVAWSLGLCLGDLALKWLLAEWWRTKILWALFSEAP